MSYFSFLVSSDIVVGVVVGWLDGLLESDATLLTDVSMEAMLLLLGMYDPLGDNMLPTLVALYPLLDKALLLLALLRRWSVIALKREAAVTSTASMSNISMSANSITIASNEGLFIAMKGLGQ